MDHCAARKILQSSQSYRNDASPTPIRLLLTGARGEGGDAAMADRWLASASALVDGGGELLAAHSTAHASDIISHVTLIFESSRYVDCIRSASASLPCNIPSFLPSFSSRTSNHHYLPTPLSFSLAHPLLLLLLLVPTLSPFPAPRLRLSI